MPAIATALKTRFDLILDFERKRLEADPHYLPTRWWFRPATCEQVMQYRDLQRTQPFFAQVWLWTRTFEEVENLQDTNGGAVKLKAGDLTGVKPEWVCELVPKVESESDPPESDFASSGSPSG